MNEQRFFSFRKVPDWLRGMTSQLNVRTDGLAIISQNVYRATARMTIQSSSLSKPVIDIASDERGRWFVLDGAGTFWRTDLVSGFSEPLNMPIDGLDRASRIAVHDDTVYVLRGDAEEALIAMSLDLAQIKWTKSISSQESNGRGLLLTVDSQQRLLVLVQSIRDASISLLIFDAYGELLSRMELDIEHAEQTEDRFDLSVHHDQCWLLDRLAQKLIHINYSTQQIHEMAIAELSGKMQAITLDGEGRAWLLCEDDADNKMQLLYRMDETGRVLERGYPGHTHAARMYARTGSLYLVDRQALVIHQVQPVSETAVWEATGRRVGIWLSDGLDSGIPGNVWHKIVVHATTTSDTQLNFRFFAQDTTDIAVAGQRLDLNHYIRDSSIPVQDKLETLSKLWSEPLTDPDDALLHVKGRYLWIYIELIGSQQHTPIVHSMEVHFPRQSYLQYLPTIYERNPATKHFLERFLSIFQTLLEETDEGIRQAVRALDPQHAGSASLRWLLGWLGIEADDHWSDEQLMALLKQAPILYNMRGTRYAMEAMVQIYTGEKPIILEYDQVKPLKENPELEDVAEKLYAAEPNVFNVLVKPEHADTEVKRLTLEQIIDAFKPVFSTGKLVILQPWVYMDLHSYLGLNTVLSEPTLLKLDGRSSMPHHTITIDVGRSNRVDQHTRLGIDSRLE